MMEDERAILVQVLIEPETRCNTSQNISEFCLTVPERVASQVDPVKLDQVKGPQEHAVVSIPSPDQLKISDPIITAGDGFAIDDAGSGAQPRKSLDDQGEARR